jgi:threonine synthase
MDRLVCASCGRTYGLDEFRWNCLCGGLLDIEFEAILDPAAIAAGGPGLWRYRRAIPVGGDDHIVTMGEGFTPFREFTLAGRTVLVKEEYLNPTGSFKDRGASVLVSKLRELGIRHVVEDSSGNAGIAIAAYCRSAGIKCSVYVPQGISARKAGRIRHYRAELHKVRGCREDCARAAVRAARNTYYAGHAHNPFFLQGTKTFAYEICEQLGWRSPDAVVLPVGNGTLLLGTYIGFRDLMAAGLAGSIPRLIGVQASNCAPLYRALRDGLDDVPEMAGEETAASGIAVASPVRARQILQVIRETSGDLLAVDEMEIAAALRDAAARGLEIEPTAAATLAGLAGYLAAGEAPELIVSAFTGGGDGPPIPL